jgi:hypothetical protein
VVHRRMLSIVVIPSRLSFPHCLSSVVPSVVRRRHTALVHPQSTRRAVARQRGGGCSVDHHHRPCRRCLLFVIVVPVRCPCPCSLSLSLFVVVIPVIVVCRPSSLSPSSSFVVHRCSSVHPHSSSTRRLFFVVCPPSPRSTHSPPHEQLLVRLGVGGGVVVGAGGSRFEVGGEGGRWLLGGRGWAGLCCHLPLSVV